MVDVAIVQQRLLRLGQCIERLEALRRLSREEFLADRDQQAIAERNFQVALQICIDVAAHLLADEGVYIPDTYGNLFVAMAKHGWIAANLGERLRIATGLRNLLVHAYLEIDPAKLHEILQHLQDLREFGTAVQARLS